MNGLPYGIGNLFHGIHEATPGGIRREQFVRQRNPIKTALACLPFVLLVALLIAAVLTKR